MQQRPVGIVLLSFGAGFEAQCALGAGEHVTLDAAWLEAHRTDGVAGRLGIRGIPTMLLYAGGREIGRVSGAMNTQQIVGWAKDQLSRAPAAHKAS